MSQIPKLTRTQWLICFIAALGFAFDIYELLMLPLILGPALAELSPYPLTSPEFQQWSSAWAGKMFFIPAIAGGIFGMLGGYLTDIWGRRRVLTYSILLYAFAAFCAGFSTNVETLLFFRCLVFIGVCVEFVAAVAWLAELFDNPVQREKVLGYTQAFSSIGGLLVAVANGLALSYHMSLPALNVPDWLQFGGGDIKDTHAAWRYTLMSGVIPALPLILIRPFLPESPKWKEKREAGTLKRPSIAALFSPELRRTTIVSTLMFACAYGAAFGAIQHLPRIVPGLAEVKAKGAEVVAKAKTEAEAAGKPAPDAQKIARAEVQKTASNVVKVQEVGGLTGRVLLAVLVVIIVSRRKLLWVFQIPGLFLLPIVFVYAATQSLTWLYIGIFFVGLVTVGQFSFWGNYLPAAYPLHLRGTGESFAANIGGRLIGTSFAWITSTLAFTPDAAFAPTKLAYTAAGVGLAVYIAGFLLSFFLPEPKQELHD